MIGLKPHRKDRGELIRRMKKNQELECKLHESRNLWFTPRDLISKAI
jgi:hypothetical protein